VTLKPSLQVRLSQHLALTPQLQQSIRLLQLSTLELQQEVEQMLEQNPFLEVEEESPVADELPLAERALPPSDDGAGGDEGGDDPQRGVDNTDFGTTEREEWSNGTEGDDFDGIRETPSLAGSAAGQGDDDEFEPQDRSAATTTLADHLCRQLAGMRLAPEERAAVQVLIDSLDEDGYLADTIDDIAAQLVPDDEERREGLVEQLQCALRWLQSLEPAGVGARDLPECLTLQLRGQRRCEAQALAIIVCKHHLDLLARRDYRKLAAATGADEELIKAAQAMIVACEPKPGRPFGRTEATIVVPDVIVQKAARGWKVVLNPDVMPKLRINDLYAQAIKAGRGTGASGSPLAARLQEARWFVKNVQQRFETIVRVSQAIVERQKGFFTHGEIAMRPLVLREIADELGLHESTISRVTTAKYMATPLGTFELKYFFGSALATEAGGNASSTAVRALIRQLVAAEPVDKPLSDNQLAEMLGEQGIQVARRTVAKYREALKIAPANLRRAL
jgi:RNA polymerase sigma-54 factor